MPSYNENGLASMERKFAQALNAIISQSGFTDIIFPHVSKEDARMLSLFVANMIVRNPEVIHSLRDDLIASSPPDDLAPYRSLIAALGIDIAFEGIVRESVNRKLLLETGEGSFQGAVADDLNGMEGVLVCAPEGSSFVTSSFPVFPVIAKIGGAERLASLYFPLCSNMAIIYGRGKCAGIQRRASVDAGVVSKLNVACFASDYGKFLISGSEETLKEVLALAER